ncbi:unnamed protein product [Cunninghamella blakesleeana]
MSVISAQSKRSTIKSTVSTTQDDLLSVSSRQRQSKKDEAIRKKIENELNKKRFTTSTRLKQHTNRRVAGTVSALRPAHALTIREHVLVIEAAQLMAAKRSDCVLVVDNDDHLSGIFTAKDLAFRVVAEQLDPRSTIVADIMTHKPLCVTSDTSAQDALNLMVSKGFRHLPVCNEEGDIYGLLDITKCLYEALNKMERAYSSSRKLYDALEGVEREWVNSPVQFVTYMETLRDKMSCPDLNTVLDHSSPVQVPVKAQVRDVAKLMKEYHTTAVLVMDHGGLAGIFTSKDIVLRVIAAGLAPDNCSVVRVMTPHPQCCLPSTTILEGLKIMHDGHFLNLPVVDEDKNIIGLVDVLRLTYATLEQINSIEGNDGEGSSKFWNNIAASDHHTDTDSAISDSLSQAANSNMFLRNNHSPSTTPQPNRRGSIIDEIQPYDSVSSSRQQEDIKSAVSSIISNANTSDGTFSFKFNYGHKTFRFRSNDYSFSDLKAIIKQKIMADHLQLSQSYVNIEKVDENEDSWLNISYMDDENDQVLMTTDNDLQEAIQLTKKMGRDRVKLFLHDSMLPSNNENVLNERVNIEPNTLAQATAYQAKEVEGTSLVAEEEEEEEEEEISKEDNYHDEKTVSRSTSKQQKRKASKKYNSNEYNLPVPQELLLPASIVFLGVVILGVFTISKLTGNSGHHSRY